MSSSKGINNVTLFINSGGNIGDFYRIFKIPFPNELQMDSVIINFIEALGSYIYFRDLIYKDGLEAYINSQNPVNENNILQERYVAFAYFSSDLFGNIAISIKLASEGYIGESLAILRSAVDLLFSSLFASISGVSGWGMASPYYHQLNEASLDEFVVNSIGVGDEEGGTLLSDTINKVASKCFDDYLTELGIDGGNEENINQTEINISKSKIMKSLTEISAIMFKGHGNEFYKGVLMEVTSPKDFKISLMYDSRYTYRACNDHREKLLERLYKQLEIGGKFNDLKPEVKQDLEKLTFTWDISKDAEDKLPICDDCENTPVIWSIHVRFDKRSMLKYLKMNIDKASLNKINECGKSAFEMKKGDFFGDVIDRKIYAKLNPYAHGDPKDEPSISDWYKLYMKPFLKSISCIYRGIVPASEPNNT